MAIGQFSEIKTAVANWLDDANLTDRIPEFVQLCEDRNAQVLRHTRLNQQTTIRFAKAVNVASVSGTDTIVLTPDDAATAYELGDRYTFAAAGANTTTTVTVNVSGLGAKNLYKREEGETVALAAGDLVQGAAYWIYYDGTQFLLTDKGQVPRPTDHLETTRIHMQGDPRKKLEYLDPGNFAERYLASETREPVAYTVEGDYFTFGPDSDGTYYIQLHFQKRLAALSADADTNWFISNARGIYLYGILYEAAIYLEDPEGQMNYGTNWQQAIDDVMRADELMKSSGVPLGAHSEYNEGI